MEQLKEVNHRVRSGGFYWKQHRIGGVRSNASDVSDSTWYFVCEAQLSQTDTLNHPKWLMTNKMLSGILAVTSKNLSGYADTKNKRALYHDDAPSEFVKSDDKPIKRTRQLMWTLEGIYHLLTKSKIKIDADIKKQVIEWVKSQAKFYNLDLTLSETSVLEPVATLEKVEPSDKVESKVEVNYADLAESVKHVTALVKHIEYLQDRNKSLEAELAAAKVPTVKEVTQSPDKGILAKSSVNVFALNGDTPFGRSVEISSLRNKVTNISKKARALHRLELYKRKFKDFESSNPSVNINESLNQYLARRKSALESQYLTRIGLLNSEQVYILFADFWKDLNGVLVSKETFQNVLRTVFHTKNSTHRTPILKSDMVRNKFAEVCQVFCKKVPNPLNHKGEPIELDNPAYTYSKEPCIRFQVRYTSKAIDYLRENWYSLICDKNSVKV